MRVNLHYKPIMAIMLSMKTITIKDKNNIHRQDIDVGTMRTLYLINIAKNPIMNIYIAPPHTHIYSSIYYLLSAFGNTSFNGFE